MYLPTRWIAKLVDALVQEYAAYYLLDTPQERMDAFAARANCILNFTRPEDQLVVFERLEAVLRSTHSFRRPQDKP